jgi:small subunit ribosomal protein S7
MARRRRAVVRQIPPDPIYGSVELSQFINKMMVRGKKTVAQRIVYSALSELQRSTGQFPMEIFQQAVKNTTPALQVRPRRVGGATYQVPTEVRQSRGTMLAMRWIILAARARTGRPMNQRLAQELGEAARGQGAAARRREEMHRMAEANRAFVHYRW